MSITEIFPTQLTWQWSLNMIKVLWCRFQKWMGTFTILLVERSSERELFRYLSNQVFAVRTFINTKAMSVNFFLKCWKINLDLKNAAKNWEKAFSFPYDCIWIGIVNLSLLRIGYFSLAANELTSSPKIWHVNKRELFQLNCLGSDQLIW